jgi:hypothetical protein
MFRQVTAALLAILVSVAAPFTRGGSTAEAATAIIAFVTQASPAATPATSVRIAAIGDYGTNSRAERDVANLVKSWNPDFVITLGDNNYPSGAARTIDRNIGQYYADYIYPYAGAYTRSVTATNVNRFWPVLGNHDWITKGAAPYLDYFTLPNNERYYTATLGPVEIFAIDSDRSEPDGITATSKQAAWLRDALAASQARWKLVAMHHPPYSSGPHGSSITLRWPYREWGATAVLAGHDHIYERVIVDGFPYFVNGLGGGPRYPILRRTPGSVVKYNASHGAMLIDADDCRITFQFITRSSMVVDRYTIDHCQASLPRKDKDNHYLPLGSRHALADDYVNCADRKALLINSVCL